MGRSETKDEWLVGWRTPTCFPLAIDRHFPRVVRGGHEVFTVVEVSLLCLEQDAEVSGYTSTQTAEGRGAQPPKLSN